MERGVNHVGQSLFALRRITDGSNVSRIEFEAEICGATAFFQSMITGLRRISARFSGESAIAIYSLAFATSA